MNLSGPFRRRRPKDALDGIASIPGVPVESDPIEAIGIELRLAAERLNDTERRSRARQARMRRYASVAAVGVVVASGAASAVGVSVPVVDGVVDRLTGTGTDSRGRFTTSSPAEFARIRPGPGNSSERVVVPLGGGSDEVAGAAYVTVGGDICFAIANHGVDPTESLAHGLGCWQPARIKRQIVRASAAVSGVTVATAPIVAGYADDQVEAVSIKGPTGPLTAALSEPWAPRGIDRLRFRVFIGVAQVGPGTPRGVSLRRRERAGDPRNYEVVARLKSGRIITVQQ